jgi:repressor LexA
LDGDVIIVRRQERAEHREIVVALLGEEATVKRLYFQAGKSRCLCRKRGVCAHRRQRRRIVARSWGLYRNFCEIDRLARN